MLLKKTHFLLFLLLSTTAFGQYKNSVKFNVVGATMNLYSLQYERMLTKNVSFNNTFFYRSKSDIPFSNAIDKFAKSHGVGLTGIKFEYIFMNEAQVGLKGYSPEFRFYMGKKKHRPFIGVFGIYEDFDMRVPAEIEVLKHYEGHAVPFEVTLPINFTFNTLSGGVLVGKQFVWNKVGLDIVIIGPHIGVANDFYASGKNEYIIGLNAEEKDYVEQRLKARFGLRDKYFMMDLKEDGAEIQSVRKVPYLGIRGVGFNLSYNF